ncbi:MAG: PAS domain S-box protein [Sphingomonadales bacterium]
MPIPAGESERLAALRRYRILDSLPEPAFDDLTTLAAQICATPLAMVSLVDAERQWFKSAVGGPLGETPRDEAFCAHAILGEGLFVVPDALADDRFRDHPAVLGDPAIRFYAGAPLVTDDGHALGTLCVIDRVPRELDAAQRAALAALGRQVMAQLELRRRLMELAESRLAAIVESSDDAIIAKDMNGIVTDWNAGAERIFGYSAAEMVGTSILRMIPPGQRDDELAILRRIRKGEHIEHFETTRRTRDGRTIDVSICASPMRDHEGGMIGASIIARDITVQKSRERELARLSRLYEALSQVNQAIVLSRDSGELCDRVCRALVENGKFRMAWIGWRDGTTGQLAPVAQCGDDTGFLDGLVVYGATEPGAPRAEGHTFRADQPFISNDLLSDPATRAWWPALEARRFLSTAAFPIHVRGEVHGTLCVYADQTGFFHGKEIALLQEAAGDISFGLEALDNNAERERASAAAENERQFSRTMIDAMPGILYFYDGTGRFMRWNRNFEAVSGYTGKEIALMHPLDFFSADHAALVGERIAEVFEKGQSSVEADFLCKNGDLLPYFFTGRHVEYDGRDCLLGVGIDISERKRAEMALRHLNDTLEHRVAERTNELEAALLRAEAADRIKSAFLATMSHELRTPLNSIIGFTGILAQGLAGPMNEEQTKQLGMVRTSARHLLALINDVLDISKIEAGQLEVRAEPFDLPELVEGAAASVVPLAERKGLSVSTSVSPQLSGMTSDRRRVEQILLNLLNNAIKFTDTGGVTLVADRIEDFRSPAGGPPTGAVRLRVRDSGIGIAAEDLAGLFQPFRQVDTGLARQHEGTGLGLAICRRLASLLGGEITAESTPGRGSEFTVVLPLERRTA